jgi:ABC-type transport system substrate-binding protein
MWIVIIAVVAVVALIGAAVFALTRPTPAKLKIELWYNNDGHYGDTETAVALTLQNSIEECGRIDVTLRSDPWTVFIDNWVNQRMQSYLLGWYPDYFDSDNYVSPFLSAAGAESLGSYYNDSEVEQWIIDEQTDPSVRADRFQKIQGALADDVPYVPLFTGVAQAAYGNDVENVVLHPVTFKWFIVEKAAATTLAVSTSDRIQSLDPARAYDFFSIEVINQVFDTLLVYDWDTATLMPGLATEVPTLANGGISADGRRYTFHLREDLQFHDTTPLTSAEVKASIDRAIRLDLGGSAAFLLYSVGALTSTGTGGANTAAGVIETPDPLTVIFNLARPVGFFNDLMAFSVSAPVPNSYNQNGMQPSTAGSVIGSGPYELTQHVENSLIVLERAPGTYYNADLYSPDIGPIPIMDQVAITIRDNAAQLKADITTGTADVVFRTLNPPDLVDLQNRATELGITVKLGSSPQIRYLVFNVNLVPDVRVRRAIAHSVDRAAISQIVFLNTASPLYSMIPPEMPFHSPVFQSRYGDARCPDANALLAQAGYYVGFQQELVAMAREH